MRNPGWSPTTVMCPLQGEVSSNRKIESTRLAVGKGTLQDNAELSCGSRMIETLFQILNAPARVEPSEERARGRKVASDVDWSGRRREVRLAEIDRHVLKVRVSVGRAKEPCVDEMRRIAVVLASQCGGIPRSGDEGENERKGLGLPAHRVTPLFRSAFISSPFKSSYTATWRARAVHEKPAGWRPDVQENCLAQP